MKPKAPFTLCFLAALLLSTAAMLQAQTNTSWNGGTAGDWNDENNWTNGIPEGNFRAQFSFGASGSDPITVDVPTGYDSSFVIFRVGSGTDVTVALQNDSSLTTSGLSAIGHSFGGGESGPGSLTIAGPASGSATASLGSVYPGSAAWPDGSRLTYEGENLSVTQNGTARSIIGRFGDNNEFLFRAGVTATLTGLRVGGEDEVSGNRLTVSGPDTSLTIADANELQVASGAGINMTDNAIVVEEGGTLSTSRVVHVAHQAGGSSNFIRVTGSNSLFEVTDGQTLQIGNSPTNPNNLGGNYVEVTDGAQLASDGQVNIFGYDDADPSSVGPNRLTIDGTSQFQQTGGAQLRIGDGALLQLQSGGTLQSSAIQVDGGGVAELAGSGLDAPVTVSGNGVLALGPSAGLRGSAETLNLSSSLIMEQDSIMEFSLFSGTQGDSVELVAGGLLDLTGGSTLEILLDPGYNPNAGDSWALFSGLTQNIAGDFAAFDLPTLTGSLEWDTSATNEAGGWTLAVIPEPSAALLLASALGALGIFRRRRL